MALTPEELAAELDAGNLRPAYLIAGPQALFRDDARAALREHVLGPSPDAFRLDVLEGANTAPGELLDAVRALPVLGGRRLVELRDPDARRGDKLGAAIAEAVVEQCELDAEAGCVFVVTGEKIDRRSAWAREFKEPAGTVACETPKGKRGLSAFVGAEAKRRGIRLGSGAASALVDRIGPDLLALRSELEKLALFVSEGESVTARLVVDASAEVAEEPIWELTDAIGNGQTGEALRLLGRMRGAGAPAPVILGSLASHWRKLLRIESGAPVSGHPYAVKKLRAQAERYRPGELQVGLRGIWELDAILKGEGVLDPEVALERLVLNLSR